MPAANWSAAGAASYALKWSANWACSSVQVEKLNVLPLLGDDPQESSSDSFGALLPEADTEQQAAEDQGIALKRATSTAYCSATRRSSRTSALIEQRQQLAISTQARVTALQQARWLRWDCWFSRARAHSEPQRACKP
jgi:hypothetical protein